MIKMEEGRERGEKGKGRNGERGLGWSEREIEVIKKNSRRRQEERRGERGKLKVNKKQTRERDRAHDYDKD
jgi:hypothetical protein